MYGDYEAQRHWMELTIHLPMREWYTYDVHYWGLDYPPLTAYVSWACGVMCVFLLPHAISPFNQSLRHGGSWINPEWFALDDSRGFESDESKVFMRATVLALDTLVYIPALVMFVRTWQGSRSKRTQVSRLAWFVVALAEDARSLFD
jgi:alpha-1,3-glucosyltransferase